jgi:hypothetical protein
MEQALQIYIGPEPSKQIQTGKVDGIENQNPV